ncbi:MAG: hypothetical protein JWM92_93 [Candidatus Nomurabacteria bacterium]|jgi:hypothetical protein|nr:hypothetical protein [Candidatus Nomurabacteria bacterium]
MKITPFQQALNNELNRLETLFTERTGENSTILLVQPRAHKFTSRNKFSFLSFLRYRLSF